MRPAGEIRQALRGCFPAAGQGAVTWRQALEQLGQLGLVHPAAPGEQRLVQHTVENMRRAGELQPMAPVRVTGSRRPMMGYAVASAVDATDWAPRSGAGDDLMRCWPAALR